jgi:Na+/H+ antiporter NhaD/arsenite permease-like protein
MLLVFLVGYVCIAMEHKIKIDKAAIALVMAGVMWAILILTIPASAVSVNTDSFREFLAHNPAINNLNFIEQSKRFIVDFKLIEYLGDISSTLFFLIGAMTIVELIDVHKGFDIITDRITSKNKRKLLWLISGITFVMSAILDNLTTSIVMVMLLKKLIPNYKERWIFASMIIIAANSGGAWSPIGDVTTIMLWIKGKISSWPLISGVLLPSIVSAVIPLIFASKLLKGELKKAVSAEIKKQESNILSRRGRIIILILGVAALISVPVFKYFTGLPPFIGVLTTLGLIWIYTEILYSRSNLRDLHMNRVTHVIKRVDTATILFFLGILLSVMSLEASGFLNKAGAILNENVKNVYLIDVSIGILSAIVDNVPLVAVAMGMYPLADATALAAAADPAYIANFVQDGTFWQFLAYCSGVGGSLLIIGSAAGVVVMGLEKIRFNWYLKHFSLLALAGYLAGAGVYYLTKVL